MARKRLLWQLYPSYVLVAVTSLVSVGWYGAYLLEKAHIAGLDGQLRLATKLVDQELGSSLAGDDLDHLQTVCDAATAETHANLAILLPTGEALIQSGRDVRHESTGTVARDTTSGSIPPIGANDIAVRTPVVRDGHELGTIVSWVPLTTVQQSTRRLQFTLVGAGLFIAACTAAFCLIVARQVSRPFEEIREVAERFARGDLAYKLAAGDSEEMTGLAGA